MSHAAWLVVVAVVSALGGGALAYVATVVRGGYRAGFAAAEFEMAYANGRYDIPKIEVDGHELNQAAIGVIGAALQQYVRDLEGGVGARGKGGLFERRAHAVRDLIVRDRANTGRMGSEPTGNAALKSTDVARIAIWKAGIDHPSSAASD
ncbi:hypothetical protein [Burkholderia sp. Ac-20365]|uniref:hypothetical protein n=1 Tax=Burkholderia sp. Ac-20365 TaxID=2703897 RepID=UPI00197BB201|nr:hypothetical protein [Burkholderia sp. Ac-20365]MBN3761245.1 hypothetical protein [Burkholderia sp. Ac-20365]